MVTIHEGEIIYKEIYGTVNKQRIYVNPPEQLNVVVLDEEKSNGLANFFARVFLPQGFPNSVSRDYTNYQIWDTAQAFCSTITGILATQEVLRGVGVGDNTATPFAATVTWVLKDGCGHLGKIYFAYSQGTHLDAYSKKWRLYADTLNDAAMCIEIALPAFKNYTTLILCISTVMKAVVGVAGGATRAAMTQHHAIRSNLADVSAKDAAQETAVNLIASVAALVIITVFGTSLILFTIMIVLHIIFNYMAVRSVCLRTLNAPRFLQIIETYLKDEVITKPCLVNRNEPILALNMGPINLDKNLCGFNIMIGRSMREIVNQNPKAEYLKNLKEVYHYNDYILVPCIQKRKIYVFLRSSATSESILCAYFHSILYGIVICAINNYDLPIYKNPEVVSKPFPLICETLQKAEWSADRMEIPCHNFMNEPSIELMGFLNKVVEKEWMSIKPGLKQIGWDLNKNLLIIDEWRICNAKLVAKEKRLNENVSHTEFPYDLMNSSEKQLRHYSAMAEDEMKYFTIEMDADLSNQGSVDEKSVATTSNEANISRSNRETKLKKKTF